jgi:hypothetical protein
VRRAVAEEFRTDAGTLAKLVTSEPDRWDRNYVMSVGSACSSQGAAAPPEATRATAWVYEPLTTIRT